MNIENVSENNGIGGSSTVGNVNATATRTHTVTHSDIDYRGQDVNTDTDTGQYWIRMAVQISGDDANPMAYFAKQITVQPDYILSVNPSSVREDAGVTDVNVRVRVGDGVAVENDTYVILNLESTEGLNSRFRITLPTLKIPDGDTAGSGTITFTPLEEAGAQDLIVMIGGNAGAAEIVESAEIELVDTDKPSTEVNLSFSIDNLSIRDGETDIVVTATLNGEKLKNDLPIYLTILDDPDADDALREQDYTAVLNNPLVIPDRKESGKTTITIRPKNAGTGVIHIDTMNDPAITEDGSERTIMVNGASIELTGDPAKGIQLLTATPFSIREDAGLKEITLEVTLENALLTDETVTFTITDESDGLGDDFTSAEDAQRDVDYAAVLPSLTIPAGETKGTATMTVTPANNTNEDQPRAFRVNAMIGGRVHSSTGILITDDDSISEEITLEVSPTEINEGAGATTVTVTGTLHGKEFADNVVVVLVIDPDPKDPNADGDLEVDVAEATRDLDYTATLSPLVIPGGSTEGTTTITITPTADSNAEEGDEKIRLVSLGKPNAIDEDGDIQELTVDHVDITLKDSDAEAETDDGEEQTTPADPTKPSFAAATRSPTKRTWLERRLTRSCCRKLRAAKLRLRIASRPCRQACRLTRPRGRLRARRRQRPPARSTSSTR